MADSKDMTGYLEIPEPIHLPEDTEMTMELLGKLVDIHTERAKRYQVLNDYYKGKAQILDRQKDEHKANNKIVLDYPGYIVDVLLGMFIGKPINYAIGEEDQEKLDAVQEIFDLNDEQDENTEIAKMMGINGVAYELVYQDEEGNTRFNELSPMNMLMVYDDKITPEPLFALHIKDYVTADNIDDDEKEKIITVYDRANYTVYQGSDDKYSEIESKAHLFDEVPIIEFLNNDEGICDFERALSQIDAMNKAQSDSANDFEEFTDAILLLYGMLNADAEDAKKMRDDGILLLDNTSGSEQGAEWLIKSINDTAVENYKERLDRDIHKFSKVPNMGDEKFAGNVSGEAMKHKLLAMDQVIVQKQRKFKRGLQKRLKLIMSILNIKTDGDFKHTDITIVFKDNKPYNELDNITTAKTAIEAGLSKQYALSKLRDLDNVNEEIERQEQEIEGIDLIYNNLTEDEPVEETKEVIGDEENE